MSTKDGGGPVFPGLPPLMSVGPDGTIAVLPEGMTLRQWYAGMALQGLLGDADHMRAIGKAIGEKQTAIAPMTAAVAYQFADAMIAEAKK